MKSSYGLVGLEGFSLRTVSNNFRLGPSGLRDILLSNKNITTSNTFVGTLSAVGGTAPITYVLTYPAYPPPSYNNVGTYGGGSDTNMSLSLPSDINVGDLLIAGTTIVNTRSPVWPDGWTVVGDGFLAYRFADGTESSTITVSWTGTVGQAGVIFKFNGPGRIGATSDAQAQTGTVASINGITTTKAGSTVLAFIIDGSSTIPSNPTGYTSVYGNWGSFSSLSAGIRLAVVTDLNLGDTSPNVNSNVGGVWRVALLELQTPS